MITLRSPLALALGVVVLILAIPALAATAQGSGQPPAGAPADTAPQAGAGPGVAVSPGGCDTNGLLLSRPWMTRESQIEWWAWGFAYGSSVGLQLTEPSGRTTSLGSVAVDGLCEVAGVLTAGNRVAGGYTLVITGTRPSGAAAELTVPFRIASLSRQSTSGPIGPPAAPAALTPLPCMAVAATFCP